MIKQILSEFPLTDVPTERTVTEEKIRKYAYTKDEVDALIDTAVREQLPKQKELMKNQWQNIIVMPL
ncbi:MAG: hypothetical protein CM15mV12_1670 [uncultured marine virus]|nr:MAG: hypothetical protein CM15mV12_1670 [uncultured marine virus]